MRPSTANHLSKAVLDFYESTADAFDRSRQKTWEDFDFFTPYLKKNAHVLDVGCGNGRLLNYLRPFSFQSYFGIDPAARLLKKARAQHPSRFIHFRVGDFFDIPKMSRSFDAIFCIAVLHHVPSRERQIQALRNLLPLMTQNGLLYLSVWNLYRWRYFRYFLKAFFASIATFGDRFPKDLFVPWGKQNRRWRYCHAFSSRELLNLIKASGFEVVASSSSKGNHLVVARPFLASRRVSVLGVDFDGVTLNEATDLIRALHDGPGQHYIVTPNPEIVLMAQRDDAYRRILNAASLKVPDGIGILWAASLQNIPSRLAKMVLGGLRLGLLVFFQKLFSSPLPERVTGVDLMEHIVHSSYLWKTKVFLLGAAPGVAEAVAQKWRFDAIAGTYAGSPHSRDEAAIVKRINASGATLLFVAYGAPAQEKWIVRNLGKMPNVKVAFGVGGAFDFFAGKRSRAPQWLSRIGLEWLWRFAQEPKRFKRIWNAIIRFPINVLKR